MTDIKHLLAKKDYWGYLAGPDAVEFARYVRGAANKWSASTERELTALMVGKPWSEDISFTVYRRPAILDNALDRTTEDHVRAILAVANGESSTVAVARPTEAPLSDTARRMKERIAARKARHAQSQRRLRLRKMALQRQQNQ
ncbi:MAG TPA: hypothetical protein VMB47_02040 [Candidatus Aquilonibacter sp.]|nr:hypothetical protein [Candidatus Aquilonibacter sp.]